MMTHLLYPALATCLALLVYLFNFVACGYSRRTHGIKAPAVTGHPDFERKLRIQQNMVEQLILFLPSLWIFALTTDAFWAAILGVLFTIGRLLYSLAYAGDPAKRSVGFRIGLASTLVLLLGGLIGTIRLILILG